MNSDGTLRLTTMSANGVKLHPDPKTGVIPTSEYLKAYPSPYNYQKYILVDISDQTLKYYEHSKVVLSCKVVTGNVANGTTTPTGKYKIFFKKKNVDLVGADYVSHVSYWMEFASGGYGMHDATWRSSFGGTIYKYNGSHGCVNMPYSSAAKLYSLAAVGTIVIVQR